MFNRTTNRHRCNKRQHTTHRLQPHQARPIRPPTGITMPRQPLQTQVPRQHSTEFPPHRLYSQTIVRPPPSKPTWSTPIHTQSVLSFGTHRGQPQDRTRTRTKTRLSTNFEATKDGVNKLDLLGSKMDQYAKMESDFVRHAENSAHPDKQINPEPSVRVPPAHPDLDPSEEEHEVPILYNVGDPDEDDEGPQSNIHVQPDDFPPPEEPAPTPAPELRYTPPTTRPPSLNAMESKLMEKTLLGMGPYDEILIKRAHEPIKQLFHRFLVSYGAIPYPTKIGPNYDKTQMARDVINGLIEAGYLLTEEVIAGDRGQENNDAKQMDTNQQTNQMNSKHQSPAPPPQSDQTQKQPLNYAYPGLTVDQINTILINKAGNSLRSPPPKPKYFPSQHQMHTIKSDNSPMNIAGHSSLDQIRAQLEQRILSNQQVLKTPPVDGHTRPPNPNQPDPSSVLPLKEPRSISNSASSPQQANQAPSAPTPCPQSQLQPQNVGKDDSRALESINDLQSADGLGEGEFNQQLFETLGIRASTDLDPRFAQLNSTHASIQQDNPYTQLKSPLPRRDIPEKRNSHLRSKTRLSLKMDVAAALGNTKSSSPPTLETQRSQSSPKFESKPITKYPYGLAVEDPILSDRKSTMVQRIDALNARNLKISHRMLIDQLYSTLPGAGEAASKTQYNGNDERELVPRMCMASPAELYPFMVSVGLLPDHDQGELYTIVSDSRLKTAPLPPPQHRNHHSSSPHPNPSSSNGSPTPALRHVKLRPNPDYVPSPLLPNLPKSLVHTALVPLPVAQDTNLSTFSQQQPQAPSTTTKLPYSKHDLISLCFYASGAVDFLKFISEYHQHGFFLENAHLLPQHNLKQTHGERLFVDDIPILPESGHISLQVMPPAEFNLFHAELPLLRDQWEMYHLRLPEDQGNRTSPDQDSQSGDDMNKNGTAQMNSQTDRFSRMENESPHRGGTNNPPDDKQPIKSNLPHLLDLLKENLYLSSTVADFKLTMPHLHHHVDQLLSFDIDPIHGKITFSRPANLGFQSDFLSPLSPAHEWRPAGGKDQFQYSLIHDTHTHDPLDPLGELRSNVDGAQKSQTASGYRPEPGSIPYGYDNYTNSTDQAPTFFLAELKHQVQHQYTLPVARPTPKFASKSIMEWQLDRNATQLLSHYCNEAIPDELIAALPSILTTAYTKRVHDSAYLGNLAKEQYFFPSGALTKNPIMKRLAYDLAVANTKGPDDTKNTPNDGSGSFGDQGQPEDDKKSARYNPGDYGTPQFAMSPEARQRRQNRSRDRHQSDAKLDDIFA